jgi:class 3 adenylate cyclase
MPAPSDPRPALEAAIAELQSRRLALGDALVDAALAPLLERLAALGAEPETAAMPVPTEPRRRLRQVSVLFLDIVGSTQLVQRLDPEEVQATIDSALAAFAAIVTRHGGQVLRFAGDSLKASFGADDLAGTREDDAERAVHCGLALLAEAARRGDEVLRTHGHDGFNARVGIHTGTAVRGGGVENDKSLSGVAVIIAARLEQTTAAGTLRISQDTWALVRGLFDAQVQPPLAMKGVDAPITSWVVTGTKPRAFRLHARGVQGQETPLVGRQAELARFDAVLDAVLSTRTPHTLTVLADAGLGKSRLLHEFQHIVSAHPSTWWLMPARSQPSGALQPYGLLRDLLARRLEISDSDPADVARSKLVDGLAPWLAQPNDPAPELLGHLIGLDFSASPALQRLGGDARLLRDRGLTVLRLWLERLAASDGSPVVLLLDDLHWTDDASLDALVALLQAASGPLLALLCARPGLLERVPSWGDGLPAHERLTLQPLDATQAHELTRRLLQRLDPVPPELAELIQRRAEGNPFYAEELVGMLLDQGVITPDDGAGHGPGDWRFHPERLDPNRLPTTLTGVLQARLDALDPPALHALQMASVIGPVFWDDALKALDTRGPESLPELQRKALVQRRPTSAFADTDERAFQHHLLHQVSYDTVLKPQKRAAHARAAAWLTQRVGDRSDEYLAITAEHHARSGEPLQAATWFERASRSVFDRHAFKMSLQYLDLAEAQLALAGEAPPPQLQHELLRRRSLVYDNLALRDKQEQALARELAWAEAHDERAWMADALANQSLLAYRTGRLEWAGAAGRRGAELAEQADAARVAALCRGNLAWMAMDRRDLDEARRELASASRWAALARERMLRHNDGMYEAQILLIESELLMITNQHSALADVLSRALDIAVRVQAPRLECHCRDQMAEWAMVCADLPASALHIDETERRAAEFGLTHHAAIASKRRARLHLQARQWDAAEHVAQVTAGRFDALKDARNTLKCHALRAEALWRGGRVDAAVAIWQETAAALQERADETGARAARLRLADARSASGRPEDVDAGLQAVLVELPFLQDIDALDTAQLEHAARLAAWRVLHRAGHPAAAGQLALAAAELEQHLSGFSDPVVRDRVRNTIPWHRDVVEALAGRQPPGGH